jgi:hypothetical protein
MQIILLRLSKVQNAVQIDISGPHNIIMKSLDFRKNIIFDFAVNT